MRTTLRGGTLDINSALTNAGIDLNPADSPIFQQYVQPQISSFAQTAQGQSLINSFTDIPKVHSQLTAAAIQGMIEQYWPVGLLIAAGIYFVGRK